MKRKSMITLLLAFCMAFALAGCGSSGSGDGSEGSSEGSRAANESADTRESASTSQGTGSFLDCPGTGYSFDLPEGMEITKGYIYPNDVGELNYDSGVMMGWPVYVDVPEEKYYKLSDEEYQTLNSGVSFHIVCVRDVKNEKEAIEKLVSVMKKVAGEFYTEEDEKLYKSLKQIHEQDGFIWLADSPKTKSEGLKGECQKEYDAFFDATDEIISNMKFYTPKSWSGTEEGADLTFETTDLDGNPVTSEQLFSKNKITMINIWGTTCGPCIQEMPELEKLNKEFQKKGGAIIGLVNNVPVDNNTYLQDAQTIVSETGVTFPNLKVWDGFDDDLETVGTPTTYFVDSHGKIVGKPILGASVEKYKEHMEKYLSEAK